MNIPAISPFTWLFMTCFLLISVLHALSLKRLIPWSFRAHCVIMGAAWSLWQAGIIALILILPSGSALPLWMHFLGIAIALIGLIVMIWHRLLLGRARLMGGRFFDIRYDTWIRGGLYGYLRNPIYDGIFMLFVGLSLWRENIDFLILAFISLLLLNTFLASIENRKLHHSPPTL